MLYSFSHRQHLHHKTLWVFHLFPLPRWVGSCGGGGGGDHWQAGQRPLSHQQEKPLEVLRIFQKENWGRSHALERVNTSKIPGCKNRMLPLPWRRLLVPKLRGVQVGLTVSPPEQAMELVEHSHRVYLQQGLWSDGNFQRSRRSCFKSNFQAFFF